MPPVPPPPPPSSYTYAFSIKFNNEEQSVGECDDTLPNEIMLVEFRQADHLSLDEPSSFYQLLMQYSLGAVLLKLYSYLKLLLMVLFFFSAVHQM